MKEIDDLRAQLRGQQYIATAEIATALYLAQQLERPLLVEGPAGVGKTEIARAMAGLLGANLIRLQCYEGLDAAAALYDWNYPRQLLRVQMEAARPAAEVEQAIYSEEYLLRRPLLEAITGGEPKVLLIDEVDRSDEEFEALLLELLADFQVTIPELGTVRAERRPLVILTSNRTRELTDALRRRCLYLWIGYPDPEHEAAILRAKVPGASEQLTGQIVQFLGALRGLGLMKAPGVAEALDWAASLVALHRGALDEAGVTATLGVILKHQDDLARLRGPELIRMLTALRG